MSAAAPIRPGISEGELIELENQITDLEFAEETARVSPGDENDRYVLYWKTRRVIDGARRLIELARRREP